MTTHLTLAQLSRLPGYVRDELTRLTRELKEAHDRLGEGPGKSRVWAAPHSDAPTPLGPRTPIRFAFDGDLRGERWVDVELHGDGYLRVTSCGSLAVTPSAANSVHLRPVSWDLLRDIDRDNNRIGEAQS